MTYTSVDTIPAKLYLKILETGHVNLLSDKEVVEIIEEGAQNVITKKESENIWVNIQAEDAELIKDNKSDKTLNISKNIESLVAKLESINLSVFHLKMLKDADLISLLKKYGYTFTDDLESDLERIERETEGLEIKLKNYQRQLEKLQPKTKDKTGKSVPFDEVVLGYGVVTGLMFKTNQITQSEYRALINVGNQKMEAIEKSIGKNGKR